MRRRFRSQPNDAHRDAAASGFLSVYGSFHPSDGIPDVGARARLQPYLSPALNKLLADAAAAQARFSAKIKDSPPLIEGDLFSSLFEGADPVQAPGLRDKRQSGALSGRASPMQDRTAEADELDRHAASGEYAWRLAGG